MNEEKQDKRKQKQYKHLLSVENVYKRYKDKNGHIIHKKICWDCGREFESKRIDALCCSGACKQRMRRYLTWGYLLINEAQMKEKVKQKQQEHEAKGT